MPGDRFRILLLEEDPVDAELIQRSLNQSTLKFNVNHVTSLDDAISESSRYDLLLFSLTRNIKLDHLTQLRSECPTIPVVVMANLDDTVVALKAVRQGAQEYLLKGQTSSTLLIRTIRYAVERKRAEEAVRYRLEFEKLIATISTHFINISLDQIDRGINRALQAIGEFAGVDRSYLLQFQERPELVCSFEWCGEGIESQKERRRNLSEQDMKWSAQKLRQAETIRIERLSDLPPEADAERHEFTQADVQSFVCIPLIYGGLVVGYLGFDSVRLQRDWSDDIVSLLKIAGDMFVNALERKRAQWEVQRTQELLSLYSRATGEVLWDWNLRTNAVWWNDNLFQIYGHSPHGKNYNWWLEQIHAEDKRNVVDLFQTALRNGQTFCVTEYRFLCADGSYANVLNRSYIVLDEQKKPVRVVGALMQINTVKRAEPSVELGSSTFPPSV